MSDVQSINGVIYLKGNFSYYGLQQASLQLQKILQTSQDEVTISCKMAHGQDSGLLALLLFSMQINKQRGIRTNFIEVPDEILHLASLSGINANIFLD